MEKQEIFEKFNDFLKQNTTVEQVYPEILEKHGALDITTGFADKLDGISDPFERLIVGVHCVDQLDTKNWNLLPNNDIDPVDVEEMRERHENLMWVSLKANQGKINEAKKYFDKYLTQF
jgi:hypothetical protein